ncbi:MAG: 4Fe-4S binding protein [Thermosphaera aggregans]|uniref:4Fe-4S binding protein n=1 Tax=Thermosphaera aggregans TaxID=54254 RepID=UPI003C00BEDE
MVLPTLVKSLKHLATKPYTRLVPRKSSPFKTDSIRGAHLLDMSKCTGCSMCQQVCPAACIDMVVVEGDYSQNPRKRFPRIDHSKCTFCGLCVEYCPVAALSMTTVTGYELFATNKDSTLKHPHQLKESTGKVTVTKELFTVAYSSGIVSREKSVGIGGER